MSLLKIATAVEINIGFTFFAKKTAMKDIGLTQSGQMGYSFKRLTMLSALFFTELEYADENLFS